MLYHDDVLAVLDDRLLEPVEGPIVDPFDGAVRQQFEVLRALVEFRSRQGSLDLEEFEQFGMPGVEPGKRADRVWGRGRGFGRRRGVLLEDVGQERGDR